MISQATLYQATLTGSVLQKGLESRSPIRDGRKYLRLVTGNNSVNKSRCKVVQSFETFKSGHVKIRHEKTLSGSENPNDAQTIANSPDQTCTAW